MGHSGRLFLAWLVAIGLVDPSTVMPVIPPNSVRVELSDRTRYEYDLLQQQFERFRAGLHRTAFAPAVRAWLRTLSPCRQKMARSALKHAYPRGCDWGTIRVDRYRRNEATLMRSVLNADARARVRQACAGPRDRALIACLYTLRRAEVAALRWADIDLGPGMAYVEHGKGNKPSWTLLHADAQAALADWFSVTGDPPDPAPVFPNQSGGHMRPDSLGGVVQRILLRAGLWSKGIGSAHRFRRAFATEYLRANPSDLEGLRKLMRHDHIATTVGYVYLQPEDLAPRLARVNL